MKIIFDVNISVNRANDMPKLLAIYPKNKNDVIDVKQVFYALENFYGEIRAATVELIDDENQGIFGLLENLVRKILKPLFKFFPVFCLLFIFVERRFRSCL